MSLVAPWRDVCRPMITPARVGIAREVADGTV